MAGREGPTSGISLTHCHPQMGQSGAMSSLCWWFLSAVHPPCPLSQRLGCSVAPRLGRDPGAAVLVMKLESPTRTLLPFPTPAGLSRCTVSTSLAVHVLMRSLG